MDKLKNRYKDLENFKICVNIAKNHFNGGEYINVIMPKYTHLGRITREEATKICEEEKLSRKKNNSLVGQVKLMFTRVYKVDYVNDYSTMLEVMDILNQDYVDEDDFEYVLANAEEIYNSFYEQENENFGLEQ